MSGEKRRPNFRSEDLAILVDTVAEQKQVLFGEFTNYVTADSKIKIWDKIAAQINASNYSSGSNWLGGKEDMDGLGKRDKMKNAKRKMSPHMTGVVVPEASDTELKVLGIIEQDARQVCRVD